MTSSSRSWCVDRRPAPTARAGSRRGFGVRALLGAALLVPFAGSLARAESESTRPRAVAAPNLRLAAAYDYGRVDETSTVFIDGLTTQTLELDDVESHGAEGELIATLPLVAFTGLRTTVRGGFADARRSLDAVEPGQSQIDAYGVLAELFARDPEKGSFALGAGYDRLEGEGGLAADQVPGSADLQVFFPDFGSGPLDWFVRFTFSHREVEGTDQPFDVDADVYQVRAGARWYATPDVAVVVSGRWERSEEEFLSEDDQEGGLALHWRLPFGASPVSVEVFGGGTAGISEYKESPFRGDRRLLYGARAGVTLRFFSGTSLVDSLRRYD